MEPTVITSSRASSSYFTAFARHVFSQSPQPTQASVSIANARGTACAYSIYVALRSLSPLFIVLTAATGQCLAQSPHPVQASGSMYRGFFVSVTLKSPGSPSILLISLFGFRFMFICRPTSTSLGEITHMVQSLVGKVLSSRAMRPPIVGDFSTR